MSEYHFGGACMIFLVYSFCFEVSQYTLQIYLKVH